MYKRFILIIFLQLFSVMLLSCTEVSAKHTDIKETDEVCCGGRCVGSAYCTACKNCSRCAHCNSGGSCGVCAGTRKQLYYNDNSRYYNAKPKKYNNNNSVGGYDNTTIYYTRKKINLREYPSLQAPIIIQIPSGIKVNLESKEGNWYYISCYISEDYYQGYIHKSVVK